MTTYTSEIKTILFDNKVVFAKLSDLKNLESMLDKVPAEAGISKVECDTDFVSFEVNPVGRIVLRIIEREEYKTIKFESENSPLAFNMWIQLVNKGDEDTKMKLTLKADIPLMVKMMLGNKLDTFVNQFADGLAKINYNE